MSIFSWLLPKAKAPQASSLPPDGMIQPAPRVIAAPPADDPVVDLKQQRHAQREHLYEVVRSVMSRSEVLTSNYKFKVLPLNGAGRQFLVMVDLLDDHALPPERRPPVEQLITMMAAQSHDLQVNGVYWRCMMSAAGPVGQTLASPLASPIDAPSKGPTSAPVPTLSVATNDVAASQTGFEPIEPDEVLAFKKAITKGTPEGLAQAQADTMDSSRAHQGSISGFEDTQLLDSDGARSP